MKEHYEAYWNQAAPPPDDDPLAGTRASILFNLVAGLPSKPERFLDIGCGTGWLVDQAQRNGMAATGLDISESAIDRARRQYPESEFKVSEIGRDSLPVDREAFHVAASFEVIEHLMDPTALIAGLHNVLEPGGYAAITTPYHGLVKNIAIALKGFDNHYSITGDHIRFFTDASLRNLFEENGFRVEAVKHYGRLPLIWAGVFFWARKL